MSGNNNDSKLYSDFKYSKLKENTYLFDVLDDDQHSKWKQMGHLLAQHARANNKTVVFVSSSELDDLSDISSYVYERCNNISTTFIKHQHNVYFVSLINQMCDNLLPHLMEHSLYVFDAKVLLFFIEQTNNVQALSEEFLEEIKKVLSNMDQLASLPVKHEMVVSVSQGTQMLWINPSLDFDSNRQPES